MYVSPTPKEPEYYPKQTMHLLIQQTLCLEQKRTFLELIQDQIAW